MKYTINIIRNARIEEKKLEYQRIRMVALNTACFGILALSLFYSILQILMMEQVIKNEKAKVGQVKDKYKQYQQTTMNVNKSDIELLDKLQNHKIFWTEKVAAMARHLPDNYWITHFVYSNNLFDVKGFGYISKNQDQLNVINDYLTKLRQDTTFSDIFKEIYLNSTNLTDVGRQERVSFHYSALRNRDNK
ncbi:MAG: hypothetical protein PVI26_08720 [Chitinispirillia bacterium]|jgi:hypothetical protein